MVEIGFPPRIAEKRHWWSACFVGVRLVSERWAWSGKLILIDLQSGQSNIT